MGVDKDALKRLHGKIVKQAIRMNYYPACSKPDLVLGVSPHSDTSTITLLLQDDDITGLQIRHGKGWVPVKPIPNTIVANIGDVIEITNHDVSEEVIQQMKAAVAAFFELPLEEKRKYAMAANDIHGYGQGYVVSEHQKLDWCDMMFLMTFPPKYKKMKFWPVMIAGFKEAVEQYSTEILKLAEEIFANISLLMGMNRDALKRLHGEMMKQGIRMNYYPNCSRPELVLGVGPHSDASSITLLIQDDDITGLQIRHEEEWVPVKPIPNAIVMNIGDVIEGWSNGVYKSIEHRAVTNVTAARMSIATFVIPDDDVELGPVETMVDDYNRPKMYKAVKYVDYLRHTLSKKMDGKATTELLKVEIDSSCFCFSTVRKD